MESGNDILEAAAAKQGKLLLPAYLAPYLTIAQAASFSQVPESMIRELIEDGKLPHLRRGRVVLVRPSLLLRVLESLEVAKVG